MEGENELEAIVACIPENEIVRLANFSRDKNDPYSFGNKVLLDITLKKQADITETQYLLGVLRKRDFPIQELLELHQKASITLMAQLIKIGRFNHYDNIMSKYPSDSDDPKTLKRIVKQMWIRCFKTFNFIAVMKQIFRDF